MKKNSKNGFTLIELILYIALATIILLAVTEFLSLLLSSRIKNQTISEVEQQGAKVSSLITQELRNAKTIVSPAPGEKSDTLALGVGADSSSFFKADSSIMIVEGTNPAIPLTSQKVEVSELEFQNLSQINTGGTVRINFTLSYHNPSNRNEFEYRKDFYVSATLRSARAITATQADMLLVDATGARIGGMGNRDLIGILIENIGSSDITIDKMTVSWTNSSRLIREILIGGVRVWSRTGPGIPLGDQISGTELDIQDFVLISDSGSLNIDRFRFSGSMTGNTFQIIFTMLDGSQKSVGDIKWKYRI